MRGSDEYQFAWDLDSSARDRVFGRTEAHGQSEGCRGDVEARSRTLSSTARCDGNCIRGAVCRASHDETRVYSRVLLPRRCDRDRAVARSFEGQSVYPDRTALDRRFHWGSLDFFLLNSRRCPMSHLSSQPPEFNAQKLSQSPRQAGSAWAREKRFAD